MISECLKSSSYTVEPLNNGHHWEPYFCPLYPSPLTWWASDWDSLLGSVAILDSAPLSLSLQAQKQTGKKTILYTALSATRLLPWKQWQFLKAKEHYTYLWVQYTLAPSLSLSSFSTSDYFKDQDSWTTRRGSANICSSYITMWVFTSLHVGRTVYYTMYNSKHGYQISAVG